MEQGVTGTCVWEGCGVERGGEGSRVAVEEVREEDVQLGEKIGQGRYGEVSLALVLNYIHNKDGV